MVPTLIFTFGRSCGPDCATWTQPRASSLHFAPATVTCRHCVATSPPGISHEAAKLNQRGLDHLDKKDYHQAIASFREALQIQPEYAEAHLLDPSLKLPAAN